MRRGHFLGVVMDPVGDGQQDRLDRRQPHREGPGIVLDQDPDEALQGAQDHPVQHHRAVAFRRRPRCR